MNRTRLAVLLVIIALVTTVSLARGPNGLAELIPLKADGVGTETSATSFPTVSTAGTVRGEPFGTASFTTTYNTNAATAESNGTGGQCTRGTGPITLTTSDGSTLTLWQVVTDACAATAAGIDPASQTLNGAYIITGGTGRFQGATGTGNVVQGIYGQFAGSPAFLHIDGNLQRP